MTSKSKTGITWPLVPIILRGLAVLTLAIWAHMVGFGDEEKFTEMSLLDQSSELQIGDRVVFSIVQDRDPPVILFVDGSGYIKFPLIGKIAAAKKTCHALAHEVKNLYEIDFYHQATVLVKPHSDLNSRGRVVILGPVQDQGPMPIAADEVLTVANAIIRAGGFLAGADQSRVTVLRVDKENPGLETKMEVDVGRMLETGDFSSDIILEAEDRILIPRVVTEGGQFYIWGDGVNRAGLYNIPNERDFTVSKAILLAGGFSPYAEKKKVKLIRADPGLNDKERVLFVNVAQILEEGKRDFDPLIKPNDIIQVEERTIIFFQ